MRSKRWVKIRIETDGNCWKIELGGSGCVIGWKALLAFLTALLTLIGTALYHAG